MQKSKIYADSLALAERGDYENALNLMREYLARDPRNGEAWNDFGVMHFGRGDVKEDLCGTFLGNAADFGTKRDSDCESAFDFGKFNYKCSLPESFE